MFKEIVFSLCISAIFCLSYAHANEMSFEIGQDVNGFNVPFTSVKICESGTQKCKTVDKLKVDTGSVGLRIYKQALDGLNLQTRHDGTGDISVCQKMGGGTRYWGPVATADVRLGDQTAKSVNFQIVDKDFHPNTSYCDTYFREDGRNGIIGLGLAVNSNGKTYFSCKKDKCEKIEAKSEFETKNPILNLPEDNNGYVVSTPEVPQDGLKNLTGKIIFGINTKSDNSVKLSNVCKARSDGFFKLKYGEKSYWTLFDTGTNAYNLPAETNKAPFCKNSKVYLCPPSPVKYDVELQDGEKAKCASLSVSVVANVNGPESTKKSWVVQGLSEVWGKGVSHSFILGIPFFFGKDIYFVLGGKSSSVGEGPLVAF
ncbi:MAG: DUF3443 family protein [Pseudobdellovibrio sp.]